MINMNNAVSSAIPKSSNVAMISVWMIISIGFVSFTSLKNAIILFMVRFGKTKKVEAGDRHLMVSLAKLPLFMDRIALGIFPLGYVACILVFFQVFIE